VTRRGIEGSKKVNGMNTAEEVFNTNKQRCTNKNIKEYK